MVDTQRFKSRLETARQELRRQFHWISSEFPQDDTGVAEAMPQSGDDEIADEATSTYVRTLDSALARRAQDRLDSVEAALQRIQTGQFGMCTSCGKLIPVGRLDDLPWTPYCVECAQRLEVAD